MQSVTYTTSPTPVLILLPGLIAPKTKRPHEAVMQELLSERLAERCGRRNRRGVKRKMSNWPLRRRQADSDPQMSFDAVVKIVK